VSRAGIDTEFASTVPMAGSAYTFSYASLGELVIVAGFFFVEASKYSPFIPPSGSPGAAGATS